jgi:hypothetical protein
MFKGTNLYGAAVDREREWRADWNTCRVVIERTNLNWGSKFTWSVQGNERSSWYSLRRAGKPT